MESIKAGHMLAFSMKWFFSLGFFIAMTAGLCAAPDILFIVTDDQNPETIHALGNERIRTPHLDRLAAGDSFGILS